MRTTVTLAADVAAEIERLRATGLGPSEALNMLARRGMSSGSPRADYVHEASPIGIEMDVRNIGDVLETLDGPVSP